MTPSEAHEILERAIQRMQQRDATTSGAACWNAGVLHEIARDLAPFLAGELTPKGQDPQKVKPNH